MMLGGHILDIKGDPGGSRKQLNFLVKCKYVDARENMGESCSNLRDNEILLGFLNLRRLKRLIPRKFK